MWAVLNFGEETHVVPRFDERTHYFMNCWCNPTPDEERETVIVHHSLDRREFYETEQGHVIQ